MLKLNVSYFPVYSQAIKWMLFLIIGSCIVSDVETINFMSLAYLFPFIRTQLFYLIHSLSAFLINSV